MQCPEQDKHRASSCGTHSSGIHSRKWRSSVSWDQLALALLPTASEEGCSGEQLTHHHGWHNNKACTTQRLCLSYRCTWLEHVLFCLEQIALLLWCRSQQVTKENNKETPILHMEASFISVERGMHWGILSRTSLLHLDLVHSKFTIFICKQFKRPVHSFLLEHSHCLHVFSTYSWCLQESLENFNLIWLNDMFAVSDGGMSNLPHPIFLPCLLHQLVFCCVFFYFLQRCLANMCHLKHQLKVQHAIHFCLCQKNLMFPVSLLLIVKASVA